jgi:uncharacterized protein
MQKEFTFEVEGKQLDAVLVGSDVSKPADFVFIHGAGKGTKERLFSFHQELVGQGHTLLAFDQSGAGKDLENMRDSSLAKRVMEARTAIDQFADTENLTVCGSSMGGYVALKMLEYFPVKNLILFCPALYDTAAFNVPFTEQFSEIIRQPESWKNTDAMSGLGSFTGQLLVLMGEQDEVIPPGVIELINVHASRASRKEVFYIPGCPHKIQAWLLDNPQWQGIVSKKVAEFSV